MTKESREDKDKVIEAKRREAGFLPQYSDYYFESKSGDGLSVSIVILMLSGFFGGLANDLDFENSFVNFLFFFSIAQFVITILINIFFEKLKKIKGYFLEMTEIRTDLYFRPYGTISYEAVNEEIRSGRVYYRTEGLVIGQGRQRIAFHYEIGDSKAQTHMQETYALLQTHISEKLPPFDTVIFDLLDRRYFYQKSLRTRILIMLSSLLILVGLFAWRPIRFEGNVSAIILSVVEAVFLIGWELFCLFETYRYARLYAQNHAALKEKCKEYPNIRFGKGMKGYLWLFGTLLLVILVNLFIVLYL